MTFHDKTAVECLKFLGSDINFGLSKKQLERNKNLYGKNTLTKSKRRSFFARVSDALKEPMLVILMFGFVLAFGVNLGKYFKTGTGDFGECFGILGAVVLSVTITIVMEGSSEKAFATLNKIYDNLVVKVVRLGKVVTIPQSEVVVGDILILESGDKIIADGRLVESAALTVDESALTGESLPSVKDALITLNASVTLADRKNFVYSGTFVTGGTGKVLVTAVGDNTEIGNIASELSKKNQTETPLQHKLTRLGKIITFTGATCAITVFVLSIIKLALTTGITFNGVQELFVSCIILIVAAVPEGLPTIVAVSLALNMIKLAGENALIKKMTATETAGAVSVICSDKTGTLTQNKMSVISICLNDFCTVPEKLRSELMWQNFVCNSTADVITNKNGKKENHGNATECALISAFIKANKNKDYLEFRKLHKVIYRRPFSSEEKFMSTTIEIDNIKRELVKGAPEKILGLCDLTEAQKTKLNKSMDEHRRNARRILCFAHCDHSDEIEDKRYVYDGFVALADPLRPEVKDAVANCRRAGIKIKMLTGDNFTTAYSIAKELNLVKDESEVVNATELEALDDDNLKKLLKHVSVISRSTPITKLRIVRLLKETGEVVAVTGDGINDAPAIKHADVGIAMGVSGSEITKEAADLVLLDDSFATVVKAISFGRNVYRNLQRFILFQLSVNLSALLFITISAVLGLPSPFNTLQLLWINVIMDGPPALTLGLETASGDLMNLRPVKRSESIVGKKMFLRILFNGAFIASVLIFQYLTNFLGVTVLEKSAAIFTLFILFQLFNAFNSRELGSASVFKSIGKNRIMLVTFISVFFVHLFIVQVGFSLFGISPMSFSSWIKCIFVASSIVLVSELYKCFFRKVQTTLRFDKKSTRIKQN